MKEYENVFVVKASLSDEELGKLKQKVLGLVNGNGGKVFKIEDWGKRKLAFKIKNHTKGVYYLINFAANPEVVFELERNFKIMDDIIRFLTVKIKDTVDAERLNTEYTEVAIKKADLYLGEDERGDGYASRQHRGRRFSRDDNQGDERESSRDSGREAIVPDDVLADDGLKDEEDI
jgi:small subunit ribosomal protein S6